MAWKRRAKRLGSKAVKSAKKADKRLAEHASQTRRSGGGSYRKGDGRLLTVVHSPEEGKWTVRSDADRTLSKHQSKQAAESAARRRAANSDQFGQYHVLKKNPSGPNDNVERHKVHLGAKDGDNDPGAPSLPFMEPFGGGDEGGVGDDSRGPTLPFMQGPPQDDDRGETQLPFMEPPGDDSGGPHLPLGPPHWDDDDDDDWLF